jgi:hypothetical protein
MATFGFGQKTNQIMQMAYVVEDISAAINWWLMDGKTGPWFLLDSFTGPDQIYRGQQSTADVAIAMAFAGHMNIELIQPKNNNPSVYRETIDKRGYGFHHFGLAVEDTEAEARAYIARGYEEAFSADVPSGGRVRYLDDGRTEPGFIELIPATAGMDEAFTRFYLASVDWDGKDPVRPF